MKFRLHYIKFVFALATVSLLIAGCNKELPKAVPIIPPANSGQTIAQIIAADANYSILSAAITRAGSGLMVNPADITADYTLFAPTNAAFIASGIPSAAVINALPVSQVAAIVNYHFIGGMRLTSSQISTNFANMYLQSGLILAQSTPISPRMPIFPSKRGSNAWANNIPVVKADIMAANGVMHNTAAILMPPSQTIWSFVDTSANFTYLKAAVLRADSGQAATSGTSLKNAMNNALANFTVFAPNNTAFQTVLTLAITQALIKMGVPPATAQAQAQLLASTPAVFSNPALYSALPAELVKGLLSYHILGVRSFAVNFPAGDFTTPSLAGALLPNVQLKTALPSVQVRGPYNVLPGTTTPFYANVVNADRHFINGVMHTIDQVLIPAPL